jgi:lysozyme
MAVFEAIALTAYQDGTHLSIGLGSNDPSLKAGDTITLRQAFSRFKRDILVREAELQRRLKVPVKQNEYDALFSMYYQSGNRYIPTIVDAINRGDRQRAMDLWLEGDKNKAGVQKRGLRWRREEELKMFRDGQYGDLSTVKLYRGHPAQTQPELYKVRDSDFRL